MSTLPVYSVDTYSVDILTESCVILSAMKDIRLRMLCLVTDKNSLKWTFYKALWNIYNKKLLQ